MNGKNLQKSLFHRYIPIIVLSLIPIVVLIYFVVEYTVNVPHWDQWGLVPLLEKSYSGTLSFGDLWAQHNEHRAFFPKIVMLTLARFSGWNIAYELAANIIVSIGILTVITFHLQTTAKSYDRRIYWTIPIISLIIFSLSQWENWSWGWQLHIFLNIFAVVSGTIFLAHSARKRLYLFISVFMGVVATYSFSNGFLYWPVGLFVLLFLEHQTKKYKIFTITVWVIIGTILLGLYLYKYKKPEDHPSLLSFVRHPVEYVNYVFAYLGASLDCYRPKAAIFFGLFGLAVSGFSILILTKRCCTKFHVLVPYIALSLYSVFSAMLTGVARSGFGLRQALSSRYVTISNLFWICNIVLLCLLANRRHIRFKNRLVSIRPIVFLIVIIIVFFLTVNSINSVSSLKEHYRIIKPARDELLSAQPMDDELLKRLYPDPNAVRLFVEILKKYKLSVFRESRR